MKEKLRSMGVTDNNEIDLIIGHVDNIKETLANNPTWGDIAVYLAPITDDEIKKIWQCFTNGEQTKLKALQPQGKIEELAKTLKDTIKAGKERNIDLSALTHDERGELAYYIHPKYHSLLFPENKAA
jgi:hypothetical protein